MDKILQRISCIYTDYNLTTNETPHHHLRPERATPPSPGQATIGSDTLGKTPQHHSRPERATPPNPGQATIGSDTLGKTPYHHSRPERAKSLYIKFRVLCFPHTVVNLLPFQGARQMRIHYTRVPAHIARLTLG